MRRLSTRLALSVLVVLAFTLILKSAVLHVPTGTWQPTSNMQSARANAVAALVPDGRIVFAGGTDTNGYPTASAEALISVGTFSPLPPMTAARAGHAALLTATGDLLVTGGRTSGGGFVNTAEVFDSLRNTWTVLLPNMVQARAGHTMSQLLDGNILIAGGEDSSGSVAALEVYSLAQGNFAFAATLATARKNHAAAVLKDGRVLIVGGEDTQGATLASTEIYDPSTGTVSAGPTLATPRKGATATTLLDGRVLVAAGSYPEGKTQSNPAELASAEIFDPSNGTFTASASQLATARTNHVAVLLPNNNNVLIFGGTAASADLASAELYVPWNDAFQQAGNMAVARSAAAASAMGNAVGDGADIGVDGMLAVAGGNNLNSGDVYGFASVKTDHTDYAPGSIVTITGSGWQPGETVTLSFLEVPYFDKPADLTVVADANGNIFNNQFSPDALDLHVRFYVTAVGSQSGIQAQNTFTDGSAASVSGTVRSSATGNPPIQGATITCTSGCNNIPPATTTSDSTGLYVFDSSPGHGLKLAFSGNGPATLTLTATASGFNSGTVTFTVNHNGDTLTGENITLTPSTVSTTTTVSSSPINPSTYGQAVTFTATVAPSTATGTVQFNVDGNPFGSPVALTAGVATSGPTSTLTAGPHNITAVYTPSGNFTGSTGSLSQTINKATATVVVTPYTVPYDGSPHTATVTSITGVNGETGATVGAVTLSTTHTNAGTYSTDSWSFTGAANYNNIAATTITDTINKATATVVVTPYTVPYDGSPHTATVTSITGVNGETGATVGAVTLSTTHTNAGTYSTDSWSFTGAANYNNIAATTITDTINKATATVVVTPYTVPYDGSPHTATVTSITGVNGETGATVGAVTLSTTHTNAGTYSTDSWSFTGAANYNDIAATTITDTINKATATVVVMPYTVPYDGSPHTATVTSITGVNGETGATVGAVTLSTTHTNAGTYSTDSWSFTGAANYNNIAATTITDTINKATATVVVTPYTVPYDGSPHTATVTSITGVNGETGATVGAVTLSTTHTNAGTYSTDSWSFTGAANYNNIAATTITDTINKATATVVVMPYTVPYDGSPHTATVTSITGVNGETGATVGAVTLSTTHTNAGTYSTDSWSFTGAANYNDIAATTITDTINKATATVVVTPYTVPYDGSPHTATVTSITGVNGETGATVGAVTLSTTHTNAGTYSTDSWSFTGAANYNNIAATTITDTINKATATVVVTPYTVPYDGSPHTATVTSITGVNGETGATVGAVTLSTTHTNAGTYSTDSWSFTGAANYNDIAATTITDTINKATATVVVTPYTVPYDGSPHTATVTSITGVNGETGATVGAVTLSTTHTNAGTYSTDSWSFTGAANYNDIAATTITDTINKATATINVTPYNVVYDGLSHAATGTAKGVLNEDLSGLNLSGTTHTNPGDHLTDPWTFTDATGNYNNKSGTVHDNIHYQSGGSCLGSPGHQILQPINSDGTSTFKQGSTIPAKFRVCDFYGNSIGTAGLITGFQLVQINNGTITPVDETTDNSTNDLGWRFDPSAQQWIFNMSSKTAPANQANHTYYFDIALNDGSHILFNYGLK